MTKNPVLKPNMILIAGLAGACLFVPACTEEEAQAVLAGIQVVADELDNNDDVSFRDWVRSELDD